MRSYNVTGSLGKSKIYNRLNQCSFFVPTPEPWHTLSSVTRF